MHCSLINKVEDGSNLGTSVAKVNWNNMVLQNPKVRDNVQKLNDNIVNMGYADDSFEIQITGGDRYRSSKDKNIHRSSSTGKIEPDSSSTSPHLKERGARAVDVKYTGISKVTFFEAHEDTDFTKWNYLDTYKDGHTHIALPNEDTYKLKEKNE